MTKADAIKERLAFIRLGLTAFTGLVFVIFWGVYQNESLVNNMSETSRWEIEIVIIIFVAVILYFIVEYHGECVN